jgi:predicted phage terminase large subunit-like protein
MGPNFLLLDQVRARMDCPATVKAIRVLTAKWPYTLAKLIEDKANGSAVIQMLANEVSGLLPITPEGGKVARAAAVSPLIEAGNVYLPHPQFAPWVNDLIEECAAFPNGAHDDQVDAMTQALLRWNVLPNQAVVCYHEPYQISPY